MKNDGRKFDSYYISLVKDYVEQSGFKFISKQDIDMFYQSLTKIWFKTFLFPQKRKS